MSNQNKLQTIVKITVPENWNRKEKGDFLENLVSKLLQHARYKVTENVAFTGMEIDVLAEHLDSKNKAFAECKFHQPSDSLKAGVIDKLIGKAYRKRVRLAYLFSTAPLSTGAKGALDELEVDEDINICFVGPEQLVEWFISTKMVDFPDLGNIVSKRQNITSLNLLITPKHMLWVALESKEGVPFTGIVFRASNPNEVCEKLEKNCIEEVSKNWPSLEIIDAYEVLNKAQDITSENYVKESSEIVTSITMADRYDDYRPCHPKEFIGRKNLQKDFCDFLGMVAKQRSDTRIVCFSGLSGFGKSSTVLKLHYEFKKRKFYKNRAQ